MAQGIKVPLETENGRLKLISRDAYIQQMLFVALGEGESDNPFQDPGMGEFMIFDINDELTEGEIKARIVAIFESFEADQLAKLDNPEIDLVFSEEGQEKLLDLTYINMETQERVDIEVPIPPAAT